MVRRSGRRAEWLEEHPLREGVARVAVVLDEEAVRHRGREVDMELLARVPCGATGGSCACAYAATFTHSVTPPTNIASGFGIAMRPCSTRSRNP